MRLLSVEFIYYFFFLAPMVVVGGYRIKHQKTSTRPARSNQTQIQNREAINLGPVEFAVGVRGGGVKKEKV